MAGEKLYASGYSLLTPHRLETRRFASRSASRSGRTATIFQHITNGNLSFLSMIPHNNKSVLLLGEFLFPLVFMSNEDGANNANIIKENLPSINIIHPSHRANDRIEHVRMVVDQMQPDFEALISPYRLRSGWHDRRREFWWDDELFVLLKLKYS